MTRRKLISLAASAAVPGEAFEAGEPRNQSYPLRSIEGQLTPPEMFFVREHFREPAISLHAWKLRVEGRVAQPFTLTLSDLLESETVRVEAVLECAGNVEGGSAVSNAVWEGVSFRQLLEQARPQADAANVLLIGSDRGRLVDGAPESPYMRLVPIGKCLDAKSLIAFKLNDHFLPRSNGFPARAVFPGWYGMDSVKWLEGIVVLGEGETAENYRASGMPRLYNRVLRDAEGKDTVTRLTQVQVKSAISWPYEGSVLPVSTHTVRGFAWSGAGRIKGVELSTDGGRTWRPARIAAAQNELGWVKWSASWSPAPGRYALMSRAIDDAGNRQPQQRERGRKDAYELNWSKPFSCTVS